MVAAGKVAGHDIGHCVVTWKKSPCHEFAKLLNSFSFGFLKVLSVMFAFRCLDVGST